MRELVIVLLCAGACGPTSAPPEAPAAPADPDAQALVHTWIVAEHVLATGAPITDADARGFHGRTIDVTDAGFTSPWQGACEEASRTRRPRELKGVMIEYAIPHADRPRVEAFGLGAEVTEFRMTCNDRRKPPPLTLYIGNERAMSCFGGACYLMTRF